MSPETGPQFLKEKYDNSKNPDDTRGLHNAPEVQRSANFVSNESGENLNSPDEKIGAYLDRLEGFFEDADPRKRERKVGFLKNKLFNLLVTKPEDVPASYDNFIINAIEERGERGHWDNASDEEKDKIRQSNIEGMLAGQKDSLETWVDYLSSNDAMYPTWLKYWAFRSIANLQDYEKPEIDKETGRRKTEGRFPQRSKGTLKMFPDLNYEALSYVLDNINQKYQNKSPEIPYDIQEDEKTRFMNFLKNENFAKLYAWSIENIRPIDEKLMAITEGDWVKFPQGADPASYIPEGFDRSLVNSIRGKGTGWCTAGVNTAKAQLENGDFYVYYSKDQDKQSTIPRIAIRMQQGNIAEVRGIARKQNLDPFIGDVLKAKLEEFPDKDQYLKKERDMARLTEIKNKTKADEDLNQEDLKFLYEVDSKIEGFGYVDDPRIKELRNGRNLEADLLVLFDCEPAQIARTPEQVDQNTKAYIGPLFSGIFSKFPELKNVYVENFPEGKITRGKFTTEGKTGPQKQSELEAREIKISEFSKSMLQSPEFTVTKAGEKITTVRLRVRDLFSDENSHTYSEILSRANELGLDFLPHETAADLLLSDDEKNQPRMGEWFTVVSEKISDRDGRPSVFRLDRRVDGLWLRDRWASPTREWGPDCEFVFGLRNVSQET